MPTPLVKQSVRLSATANSATPNPSDPAWRAWQAHVDAGRIGSRPSRSFEQRLRMMKSEVAVFGRVVTPELGEF